MKPLQLVVDAVDIPEVAGIVDPLCLVSDKFATLEVHVYHWK